MLPAATEALSDVPSAGAGKPTVLVDDVEACARMSGSDVRVDSPGAGSTGGGKGVMCATVAYHPCRKYVTMLSSFGGSACLAETASG